MGVKNIYVRNGDESFWGWAQAESDKAGVALSVWLTRLIRNHKTRTATGEQTDLTPVEILEMTTSQLGEVIDELRKQEPES